MPMKQPKPVMTPSQQYEADVRSLQRTLPRMRGRDRERARKPEPEPQQRPSPERRMGKVGLRLDLDALDGLRSAVAQVQQRDARVSLEGEVVAAMRHQRRKLELQHNDGEPFGGRRGLRSGRRPRGGADSEAVWRDLTPMERAQEVLIDELCEGPRPAREVKAMARVRGVSARTLRRACEALAVETERRSVGFGGGGEWLWLLPGAVLTQGVRKGANAQASLRKKRG
jgi:hypothetical protein